ncbi:GerAB/ArcD/ProY family transporter [Clostridium bovifaecis]|uniref:GerAB/ArcD/ProY family transporter n=1 Tax=Clostridium bovifaecis TaxID=2184719 RepID=A0A6I6EM96_9CLOT|nr:GerAB/ArcD/ProY family transporter [Clostridium bovifaecis]
MKETISASQLFIMIVLLPYSSAVLFFLAPEAEADAWVAMLVYIIGAIFLQLIYISLYNRFPMDTIITYMPKIYGKILGNMISILYVVYFTYLASRVVRDYIELTRFFGLMETPMIIVAAAFILTAMYDVYCGIEVIARTVEIAFLFLIFSPAVIWILLSLTRGGISSNNLEPIFSEGIGFVITNGWKLITFPYGESIVFTMIYPFVKEGSKKIKTASISAVIFLGIILALNQFSFIVTLGLESAKNVTFPLFKAASLVKIGEFITRIEIMAISMIVVGGVYKVGMFMYNAVLGTAQLFKMQSRSYIIIPFGVIILFLSQVIAKSYFQHIEIGLDFTPKYIHLPMQIVIPTIALIIANIKDLSKDKKAEKEENRSLS